MEIDRRTLARSAVWSLPVITLAQAVPAYAASPAPTCPTCLTATGGAFTEQATVLGGSTTAATTGDLAFNLSSTGCNLNLFQPAYTVVGTSAAVTYTGGDVQTFSVAAITGTGTFGAVSAFTAAFSAPTNQVTIPNGTGFAGAYQNNQKEPVSITVRFNAIFVGLPSLISITCPYTVTFTLTTNGVGTVAAGAGTVNFTGTASGGTITGG